VIAPRSSASSEKPNRRRWSPTWRALRAPRITAGTWGCCSTQRAATLAMVVPCWGPGRGACGAAGWVRERPSRGRAVAAAAGPAQRRRRRSPSRPPHPTRSTHLVRDRLQPRQQPLQPRPAAEALHQHRRVLALMGEEGAGWGGGLVGWAAREPAALRCGQPVRQRRPKLRRRRAAGRRVPSTFAAPKSAPNHHPPRL
jgi:hypothetical protein